MPLRYFLSLLLFPALAHSLSPVELPVRGYGLGIGNTRRTAGIRINLIDRQVEQVEGINLTLWKPGRNPDALFQGIALGLIGPQAGRIDGIALGGAGVAARRRIRGIALGGLVAGTRELTGLAGSLGRVEVEDSARGVLVGGLWIGRNKRLAGLAFSPGGVIVGRAKGVVAGGLLAGAGVRLTGIAVSLGLSFSPQIEGIALGGLATGGRRIRGIAASTLWTSAEESLDGVACSLGIVRSGARIDGLSIGGLGVVGKQVRGVAIGGGSVLAEQAKGLTCALLNGLTIERIDLEEFLRFKVSNQRFTGLSLGLINCTRELKGVQIGLVNYAENNPSWLRLVPLVNLHL